MGKEEEDSQNLIDASEQLFGIRKSLFSQRERATIIYIDLSDSTEYKEKRGHVRGIARNIHFNLTVSKIIRKKCGKFVDEGLIQDWEVVKYIGDEIMGYVRGNQSQEAAIRTAIEIQRRHFEDNKTKQDPLEETEAKIGINTGDVLFAQYDESGPKDPQGLPVDVAARLTSLAKAGQILISSENGEGIELSEDYGVGDPVFRELKGLGERVEVAEIDWGQRYQDIKAGDKSSISAIEAGPNRVERFLDENDLLEGPMRIDLSLYTFETLAATIRPRLINSDEDLHFRILIRNPKHDQIKATHVRSSVRTIREIVQKNDDITFSIRFYESPPMLRTYSFHDLDKSNLVGLCGIYKYDTDAPAKFVGAEGNQLIICKNRSDIERSLLNAHVSRFEYSWETLSEDRAVIFDLDGLLVDTMPFYEKAWQTGFEQFNFNNIPPATFYEREGEDSEVTVREIYKQYRDKEAPEEIVEAIITRRDEVLNEIYTPEFFPGARKLLERFEDKGLKTCLVTGTSNPSEKMGDNAQFLDRFDYIISSADKSAAESRQNPYKLALRNMNIDSGQAVVVENAPLGIECATAAGIPTIAVDQNDMISSEEFTEAGAMRVYNSLSEIASILLLMDTNYDQKELLSMLD